MNVIRTQYKKTAIGELILGAFDDQLCLLDFRYRKMRDTVDRRVKQHLNAEYQVAKAPVLAEASKQLDAFLAAELQEFDLPLLTVGTDFQQQVWAALKTIPYGATASYSDIAETIGQPASVRAVANANGANAIALAIPCHRIIGRDNSLTGYGGGLRSKQFLLDLERPNLFSQSISINQ